MYYKKQKQKIVAGIILLFVIGIGICVFSMLSNKNTVQEQTETQSETEQKESYFVTIYKTEDAEYKVDDTQKSTEDNMKVRLYVQEGEPVDFEVIPVSGKKYLSAEILGSSTMTVSMQEKAIEKGEQLTFTMPAENVVIHILCGKDYAALTEPQVTESTYAVTVEGMNKQTLKTYKGKYKEKKLVKDFGDCFRVGFAGSEYEAITKIVFANESEEITDDYVSQYFYFNGDENWKGVVTYHFFENIYTFRDLREEIPETEKETTLESEQPETTQVTEQLQSTEPAVTNTPATSELPAGGQESEEVEPEISREETTFNLTDIPDVFIDEIGNEQDFFDQVFDYIYRCGLTGNITGEFQTFDIKNNGKITFSVYLDTGGTIEGVYKDGEYKLSGL